MANMVLSSENLESSNRVSTTTTCDDGRTYLFVSNVVAGDASAVKPLKTSNNNKVSGGGTKRPRADSSSSAGSNPPELMRCKRRINFTAGYALPHHQPSTTTTTMTTTTSQPPTAVARRNERERNRVKLVNLGFATLREHVPNGSKNKKMSKVETLRSAVEYIRKLQELLDADDGTLDALFAAAAASSSSALSTTSSSVGSPQPAEQNENIVPLSSGIASSSALNPSSSSSPNNNSDSAELCYSLNTMATSMATTGDGVLNTNGGLVTCPPSSVSPTCSVASSPTPSYTSECSFYEPLSPEEAELLDFTNWFT